MVSVEVRRDPEGRITAYTVQGHAGQAPYGRDVVCAAVSALAQGAVHGLEQVAGVRPTVVRRDGYLAVTLPQPIIPGAMAQCQVILKTLVVSMVELARQHPGMVACLMQDAERRRAAHGIRGKRQLSPRRERGA